MTQCCSVLDATIGFTSAVSDFSRNEDVDSSSVAAPVRLHFHAPALLRLIVDTSQVENKVSKDKEHKEAEEAKLLVQACRNHSLFPWKRLRGVGVPGQAGEVRSA